MAYYRIVGDRRDLWAVPSAGGQPWRITLGSGANIHPAWSPDGARLAFASDRDGTRLGIWTLAMRDGRPAAEPRRVSPSQLTAGYPVFSPDGARIAYIAHLEGHNYPFVVPSDGSAPPVRVAGVVDAHRLRWNATTGELWISHADDDGALTIRAVAPDLSTIRDLEPPFVFHAAVEIGLFDINGDGRLIVYSRPKRTGNIWLLELAAGAF